MTLPKEAAGRKLTIYRAVFLAGKWQRIEEPVAVRNERGVTSEYTMDWSVTILPDNRSPMDTLPPVGLYRLELYADGEPLHFQPFRFWYEGNVLHADEAEGQ
jgi:hypothetical protein